MPVGWLVRGSVAWYEKLASNGVAREISTPIAGLGPALIAVAKAVAAVPTITDRLLGRTAAASGIRVDTIPRAASAWISPKPLSKSKPGDPMSMAVCSSAE